MILPAEYFTFLLEWVLFVFVIGFMSAKFWILLLRDQWVLESGHSYIHIYPLFLLALMILEMLFRVRSFFKKIYKNILKNFCD
jgi:hypothetical protein